MCPFSFPIIPSVRSFVVLKTVWNNIHACFNICTGDRTSDGKKFKHATTAVTGQNIIDVRPFACFFSYFSVPTRHRVVLMLYVLKCFLFSFSMYKYVVLPPLNYTRFIPFLGVMVAEFCSLWQQNDTIQMLLCLIPPRCFAYPVTLPSFSSFSLYVVPSFCRFLSTFVFAHFRRYCRCSSRVDAVFSVPRPFRSAFRASRCYLCAPFAFFLFLSAFMLNNHRRPAICPTAPPTGKT